MIIYDYKQIPNYPKYFINTSGNSVIKLCRQDLYSVINGEPYYRDSPKKSYKKIADDKYFVMNNLVFRRLKISDNQIGYKIVKLTNTYGSKNLYVHRLVYRTFVGVIPQNKEVNHIDHNKENNTVNNLELLTHSENMRKSIEHYGGVLLKRCKQCAKKLRGHMKEKQYCNRCRPTKPHTLSKKQEESHKARRVVERPSAERLWELVQTLSFLEIGRLYGVTDNTIRKWCKSYELPYRKRDIERRIEKNNQALETHCIGEG